MPWNDLHSAAFERDPKHAKDLLLRASLDVNQPADNGFTPLIIAAQEGNTRVVALLLKHGARLDAAANDGATALMMSAQNAHPTVIPLLLDAGADLETRNKHGATALFLSVVGQSTPAAKMLIEAGADVNTVSADGETPLFMAVVRRTISTAKLLLEAGAKVNTAKFGGQTPLSMAAADGQSAMVDLLIGANANVDAANRNGGPPILAAAYSGHLAVVESLIGAGAEVDPRNKQVITPLHAATHNGHSSVALALIRAGADPCTHLDNGETPLYSAAFEGLADVVRELLRARADPAFPMVKPDGTRALPIDVAAQNGHEETVRCLLELGIQACGGPAHGRDALCLASNKQHVRIMGLLMDAGVADPGYALLGAIDQGCEEAVKLLLRRNGGGSGGRGGYVNRYVELRCDCLASTPIVNAVDVASPRITRMLLDAGADENVAVPAADKQGLVFFKGTPLALTIRNLRKKECRGVPATEEQLHRLEAVRRMLIQVEAVRALSWLWPGFLPRVICAPGKTAGGGATSSEAQDLTLAMTVRAGTEARHRAILRTLFR